MRIELTLPPWQAVGYHYIMDAKIKSKVDVTGIEPVTCCISDNRSKPTELYVIKLEAKTKFTK